jgi:enediyne biosynthesis protein E4
MQRRSFLTACSSVISATAWAAPPFSLTDITGAAGISGRHQNGAVGKKWLPETMGPGAAFFDFDGDGWTDLVVVNGGNWSAKTSSGVTRAGLTLYKNQRNGTFRDVTAGSGLDVPLFGMGVAAGDFNNDGLPDLYVTTYGQNRLFQNLGNGKFQDITNSSGLGKRQSFSTSALWFDYDNDGLLDLFVCNYVKWSPEADVYCTLDGKRRSYCTPEAYPGASCWLFKNRGGGRFEDVTVKAGLFDASSKSLGCTVLDLNDDGWLDLFVANDTQPNKLYRNQKNGTFRDSAVTSGVAFSEDGKARAGMGVDANYLDASGRPFVVVTNFQKEMAGLYRLNPNGQFLDIAAKSGVAAATKNNLGFGCFFFDADLDGRLDLLIANGHIDESASALGPGIQYAQSPALLLQQPDGRMNDVSSSVGKSFSNPKVARGACFADIDRDGDLEILLTTNNGPAHLFRNDQANGSAAKRTVRLTLQGTKSNRDAIGARVEVFSGSWHYFRMVKGSGSYLSQSELPLTLAVSPSGKIDRLIIKWPSGRLEEHKNLSPGPITIKEA